MATLQVSGDQFTGRAMLGQLGTDRRVDAYVHVVESPSSAQLFEGPTAGRRLTEALRVVGIRSWHRVVSDLDSLDLSLGQDLIRAIRHHDALPMLHLSVQVSRNGIQLTDGTFLPLDELTRRLTPLNRALDDGLLVCMPDCSGTAAARMATVDDELIPYHAIVGSHDEVAPSDAALGFAAFYHRLLGGTSIDAAMDALTAASGALSFYVQYSGEVRTVFRPLPPENPPPGHRQPPPSSPPA